MRKLKIIVSDLHLGKGQVLEDGSINVFEEFYFDDKFVEFLDHYSTDEFSGADVELILNGDVFNLLQADYKGHYLTVITESIDLFKLKLIVSGHHKFFEALRRFAARPGKKITYIVGNHDQGLMWPKCREYLDEICQTRVNFKNIVYFFDGVHIEHGHQHEAANRINPKKFFLKKDLPEPILNLPWGSHFFVEYVLKVKNDIAAVDKARPFHSLVRWSLFFNFFKSIKWIFRFFVYLSKSNHGKEKFRQSNLKEGLMIAKEVAVFPNLEIAAMKILNDDRVHTVIFGHTHVYLYRQWGRNKEYLNSGTWTEITSLDLESLGKFTKLTYVLIEYPPEGGRARARLKEWKGHYRVEMDVAI